MFRQHAAFDNVKASPRVHLGEVRGDKNACGEASATLSRARGCATPTEISIPRYDGRRTVPVTLLTQRLASAAPCMSHAPAAPYRV